MSDPEEGAGSTEDSHLARRAFRGSLRRARAAVLPVANLAVRCRAPSGRPIFVTGNGRSGTSWIGETLGKAPGVVYYREPCNLPAAEQPDDTVWARYVPPEGRDPFFESRLGRSFRGLVEEHDSAPFRALARRWSGPYRVVIKEVATFPSVEWVARRWNPEVLLVVRHPCACALSVGNAALDRTERARLTHLLEDDRRKEGHLEPYREHLLSARTPLEVSAAIWSAKSVIVSKAHARHDDWRLVRYEDICDDPLGRFRSLYADLGLGWTQEVEAWVEESTSESSEGAFSTRRVSALQRDAWRRTMTPRQIGEVRRIVEGIGLPYYTSDADWRCEEET
jgi:hypothetical protein